MNMGRNTAPNRPRNSSRVTTRSGLLFIHA
jgi:hypothetical protein